MVVFNPVKSERRSVPALIKAPRGSTSTQSSGKDEKVIEARKPACPIIYGIQ